MPFLCRFWFGTCAISCASIEPFGIAGFAVTIPHKERILRHLDDCDPLAARIGAVNTVVVRGGGRLYGYNTDYVGVLRSLERRMRLAGSRVLLFGAGGAARAAAFALAQAGSIVCLSCAATGTRPGAGPRRRSSGGGARPSLRREFFDAIVNCTPVGMHPRGGSPLGSAELNCRIVMDMVYRPRTTELLQMRAPNGASRPFPESKCFSRKASRSMKSGPASARRKPPCAARLTTALEREEKSQGQRRDERASVIRMIQPDFKTFCKLARQGNLVPVYDTVHGRYAHAGLRLPAPRA